MGMESQSRQLALEPQQTSRFLAAHPRPRKRPPPRAQHPYAANAKRIARLHPARMDASHLQNGVHAGLAMLQKTPNGLQIVEEAGKRKLQFFADNESSSGPELKANAIELRVHVNGDRAVYSYSLD